MRRRQTVDFQIIVILGGAGFGAGLLGALLGLGGGFIVIPLLTLVFGVPIHLAIGASIVAVIATSTAGSTVYLKGRLTNLRLAMLLEAATTAGAVAGAFTAVLLAGDVLGAVYGLVLICVGVYMMGRHRTERENRTQTEIEPSTPNSPTAEYYDSNTHSKVEYRIRRLSIGMLISFVAGELSGLLGVGGGVIKVPLMNVVMKVPMKVAVATSNFMIGITAAASAFIYFSHGYVQPLIAIPIILGIVAGAHLGSGLERRVKLHVKEDLRRSSHICRDVNAPSSFGDTYLSLRVIECWVDGFEGEMLNLTEWSEVFLP